MDSAGEVLLEASVVPVLHDTTAASSFAKEVSELDLKLKELDEQISTQKNLMKNATKKIKQGAWGKEMKEVKKNKHKRKNSDNAKDLENELVSKLQIIYTEMQGTLTALAHQALETQSRLISSRKLWIELLQKQVDERKEKMRSMTVDVAQVDPTLRIQTSSELEEFLEQQNALLRNNLLDKSLKLELIRKSEKKISKLKAFERELVSKFLGSFLSSRSSKADLVEKNILFDSSYDCELSFKLEFSPIEFTLSEVRQIEAYEKELEKAGLLLKLEDIQLGDVIGEGAYSLVRQGWLQGKLVAVKQLKTLRSSTIKAFMREINALRVATQSPHVIKLIGACTKNLKLCIVTPYLKGGSIHDLIYKKHVQFTREQAFRLAIETASGMQYLHENRIIHRDLTPTNILLHPNENGKSFIADFGISLFKEEKGPMSISPKGHPRYKAPEICRKQSYTKKVDSFMFGTVLYMLFSNKRPYEGVDDAEVAKKMAEGQVPSMTEDIPEDLQKLILRCWDLVPKNRPHFDEILRILTREEAKKNFSSKNKSLSAPSIDTRKVKSLINKEKKNFNEHNKIIV
jgi:hypothetical protein